MIHYDEQNKNAVFIQAEDQDRNALTPQLRLREPFRQSRWGVAIVETIWHREPSPTPPPKKKKRERREKDNQFPKKTRPRMRSGRYKNGERTGIKGCRIPLIFIFYFFHFFVFFIFLFANDMEEGNYQASQKNNSWHGMIHKSTLFKFMERDQSRSEQSRAKAGVQCTQNKPPKIAHFLYNNNNSNNNKT